MILTAAERSLRCYNFLIDDGNFLPSEISLITLRVLESTGRKRKSRDGVGRLRRLGSLCASFRPGQGRAAQKQCARSALVEEARSCLATQRASAGECGLRRPAVQPRAPSSAKPPVSCSFKIQETKGNTSPLSNVCLKPGIQQRF